MKNKSFATQAFVIAAFLLAFTFTLNATSVLSIPIAVYIIIMAFALLSILLYRKLSKSNRENPKRFISAFMGAIGIKLFASLIFLVLYLFIVRDDTRIPVTISLFLVYVIYTMALIRQLMNEIKEIEDSNPTQ